MRFQRTVVNVLLLCHVDPPYACQNLCLSKNTKMVVADTAIGLGDATIGSTVYAVQPMSDKASIAQSSMR